jgi:hypothetical protein
MAASRKPTITRPRIWKTGTARPPGSSWRYSFWAATSLLTSRSVSWKPFAVSHDLARWQTGQVGVMYIVIGVPAME